MTFNLAAVCSRLQQACCANARVHLSDNTHIYTHTHAQRCSLHACTVFEPKRDKQSEQQQEEEEEGGSRTGSVWGSSAWPQLQLM